MNSADKFVLKPSFLQLTLNLFLKFSIAIFIVLFIFFYLVKGFNVDFSFIYEFLDKTIITATFIYSILSLFFIVLLIDFFSTAPIRITFFREGIECKYGFLLQETKEIKYKDLLRINFEDSFLNGKIFLEFTGTDLMKLEVPYVFHPAGYVERIRRRADDFVSEGLLSNIMSLDQEISSQKAMDLVRVVQSKNLNKENLARKIEHVSSGHTFSKGVYQILLEHLIREGRLSKTDLSTIMFELYSKNLITKKDISDVVLYLQNLNIS